MSRPWRPNRTVSVRDGEPLDQQKQSDCRLRSESLPRMLAVTAPPHASRDGHRRSRADKAYLIVGGVQLATHSLVSDPRMSSDELIDYLTMLSWSALCGIVEGRRIVGEVSRAATSFADRACLGAGSELGCPTRARAPGQIVSLLRTTNRQLTGRPTQSPGGSSSPGRSAADDPGLRPGRGRCWRSASLAWIGGSSCGRITCAASPTT